jgi:outer membrane protein
MKKIFTVLSLTVLIGLTAAAQSKIAVVSPDEVFTSMPEYKKADSSLQKYQEALIQELRDLEVEVNGMVEKFKTDSLKWSKEQKDAKREKIAEKVSELENGEQIIKQKLDKKQTELVSPLRDKMIKEIKAYAAQKGYTHVLYREMVLVSPEADDITEELKVKLGKIK